MPPNPHSRCATIKPTLSTRTDFQHHHLLHLTNTTTTQTTVHIPSRTHTMETYSLLVVTLLASLGFLAFAAKMALVTGIAFLPVAAYLALLVVFFVAAICLAASRSYHIAHGEQLLTACQAEASKERRSSATTIEALKRQLAKNEAILAGERYDRDSRFQDISARNRSHLQEIAGLHAILKQVKSESVDISRVEFAMRIERQWSLLRDIMVEGGIKATTEQEWQRAVTELVQRKPSTSTPIGVVSGDLETARVQLAKEIYDNKTAQLKAQRLEHSLDAARLTVDILNNDLEQSRADNGAKQRNIDHLRQQLDAEQKKECGGEEKASKWQRMLANTEKQCKKEHSRFLEATGKFQAEKRTVSQRDKDIKSLQDDIANTNTQKEQLQKKLNDSQATEEQKGKDLEQAQRRIKEQEDKISELDSHLTKETKEKVTLTNDLETSQAALRSAQNTLVPTQNALKSTQDALTSTQRRLGEQEQHASSYVSQLEGQISEMKNQAENALAARIAPLQQEKEDQATASDARIAELELTIKFKDELMVQYEDEKEQLEQQLNNALQSLGNSFAHFMEIPAETIDPQLFNLNSNYTQEEIDQTFSSSALNDPSLPGSSSFPTYTGETTADDGAFDDFINNDQVEGFDLPLGTDVTIQDGEVVFNDPGFKPFDMEEWPNTPQDLPTYSTYQSEYETNNNGQGTSSDALPPPQGRKRRAE